MTENKVKKEYISTSELARLLGVSRVAVFKKIKSGKIKAFKVGRNYVISIEEFYNAIGTFISPEKKEKLNEIVKKAVEEYGDALRRLALNKFMARPVIKKPNITEIEYIAHRLAQELLEYGEPIPPFDTRFPSKLESCLETPFQTFDRKSLYKGFESKASILFYLMVKNHPFQNGNKRVAVVTLIYFLYSNGRRLKVGNTELYEFSRKIASSEAGDKDRILIEIKDFIIKYSEIA